MSHEMIKHGTCDLYLSVDQVVANDRIVSEIEKGRYETSELNVATRFVKPTDRVLELGAGVGFISAGVMRAVRPAFYAAVEADARLIPHIRRTHQHNGVEGVEVINGVCVANPAALSEGRVEFVVHREFWQSGIDRRRRAEDTVVSVETLDASHFIEDNGINVLIADIEGAELDLLRHLRFGGLRKIVVELHPQTIGQEGVLEIFSILCAEGFAYSTALSAATVVCFEKVRARPDSHA